MKFVLIQRPTGETRGVEGVDMLANPLSLGGSRFASATNLQFDNGRIMTRPGFRFECLGVTGTFQGATFFSPSKGMSSQVFASDQKGLAFAADGKLYIAAAEEGTFPHGGFLLGGDYCFPVGCDVHLFAAEDWLIAQSLQADTVFWNGQSKAQRSPGMKEPDRDRPLNTPTLAPPSCEEGGIPAGLEGAPAVEQLEAMIPADGDDPIMAQYQGDTPLPKEDSHDSFMKERHEQWLVNAAGLGVYAHGRVHQQTPFAVFVGDIIHKRGFNSTDDLLLMEEQALESFGDPLVWASSLGPMTAFRLLPQGSTPNGQGPLIAYFANGIMTFNTFQFPRETRIDSEGRVLKAGWSEKEMGQQQTALVSAVGRYAVTDLTSDHVFRSSFGIHTLKNVLGEKSERTEQVDITSHAVKPLLTDPEEQEFLSGTAVGFSPGHNRIFCTTGMVCRGCLSSAPVGRGFVSYNQAFRFTQDRTPIPVWEGLWVPTFEIKGVHMFTHVGDSPSSGNFGFVCSGEDKKLFFGFIDTSKQADLFKGQEKPIEWSFETGQLDGAGYDVLKYIQKGRLEVYANQYSKGIRILARNNLSEHWQIWKEFDLSNLEGWTHVPLELGQHPTLGESTWVQVRVEGLGFFEMDYFSLDLSQTKTKSGNEPLRMVEPGQEDAYEITLSPVSDRWPAIQNL